MDRPLPRMLAPLTLGLFCIVSLLTPVSGLHAQGTELTERSPLKVAYTRAAPFLLEGEEGPKGINSWLWDQVAADLSIDYEWLEMDFLDMLNALEEGRVDISINPLTVTSERIDRNGVHPTAITRPTPRWSSTDPGGGSGSSVT